MQDDAGRGGQVKWAQDFAARFGAIVRVRREAMQLRQEDIAFATGFGRRFIIELEAGKPSCQLGKALAVAAVVGFRPLDLMGNASEGKDARGPDRSVGPGDARRG